VTDEWTKEGLAIEVGGRMRSAGVIAVLARLVSERGAPLYLRSDNVLRREAGYSGRQQISVH
jgi:putative transposase